MDFSIIRKNGGLVKPYEQTPSETLDLSVIDRLPVLRCNTRTLHVFRHGPEAAEVIREALSKALVPYYPLAGRLEESNNGQLQICCGGEGVWFVEASANCTLDSVNYFDNVESIPYLQLLPDYVPQDEHNEPLVQMQVTQFECGGFVIGLLFSHTICDGLGAAQFLTAVGELARNRNITQLTISPVWSRNFSPNFTTTPPPIPPPPMPNYKLQHATIDISTDHITQIKQQFNKSTSQNCSTFEVIAATFWKHRTISINLTHDTEIKLVFFANCRRVLDTPLPKGFYGNCFFPVTITVSSERLTRASDIEVIKLIREAKGKVGEEFNEYLKVGESEPFGPAVGYTSLFMSEWGRLGFNEVDYGWGKPVHVIPIQGSGIMPVGIVGSLPLGNKGVRLMTWCVEELHRPQFLLRMMKLN
ncbi:acyl transferase 4 [Euphorbia lathyris]|uniref:acyl transferase 4 n=1 Tax=Euphorbia lathyris TaxID=212925 RepID=UPI0033136D90